MTEWQDPPLTRREARERERRAAHEAAEQTAGVATPETQEVGHQATPTQSASTQAAQAVAGADHEHHNHRAAADPDQHPADQHQADQREAGGESEAQQLQGRPRLPRYDSHAAVDDLEKTLPGRLDHRARTQEHPEYYRGGRDQPSTEPVTMPVSLLREATERGASRGQDAHPRDAASAAGTATTVVPERTLTRRELRAMLQAQEANRQASGDEDSASPTPGPVRVQPQTEEQDPEEATLPRPQSWAPASARTSALAFDDLLGTQTDSGGSATASNALILPAMPKGPDATGPLTATGEILVTGSIDLPRSLGSTGQHPDRYDSAEMDRMFDAEADPRTSDVEPVLASRAISSHTSNRAFITPPQKRGSRLAVILPITAAVLAVAVIGLVIAGFVFNVF